MSDAKFMMLLVSLPLALLALIMFLYGFDAALYALVGTALGFVLTSSSR